MSCEPLGEAMRRREFIALLGSVAATLPLAAAAAQKKAPEAAQAEISGGVVKLGVLTDETGVLSAPSGEGSIEATRMAVEDFGSKAAGSRSRSSTPTTRTRRISAPR